MIFVFNTITNVQIYVIAKLFLLHRQNSIQLQTYTSIILLYSCVLIISTFELPMHVFAIRKILLTRRQLNNFKSEYRVYENNRLIFSTVCPLLVNSVRIVLTI